MIFCTSKPVNSDDYCGNPSLNRIHDKKVNSSKGFNLYMLWWGPSIGEVARLSWNRVWIFNYSMAIVNLTMLCVALLPFWKETSSQEYVSSSCLGQSLSLSIHFLRVGSVAFWGKSIWCWTIGLAIETMQIQKLQELEKLMCIKFIDGRRYWIVATWAPRGC